MSPFPTALPSSRVPDPRDAPSLRWGVIGTGWIAERFVRALQQHTDQQVVAVAARNAERAAAFAAEHGLTRSHADVEELVAAPDLDVVYIGTTHPAHLPNALLSLAAGKPTVVEKPLGVNAAEARQIADAARRGHTFCMEALWTLFTPKFDVLAQLIDSGVLGEIRTVQADHGEWFPPGHRIFDPAQAGGPMLDLGTYPVSFSGWVLGAPERVQATGHANADGLNVEAAALLSGPGDRLAVVHTTIEGNTPTRAAVTGTEATLEIDGPFYQPGGFTLRSSDNTERLRWEEPAIAHEALFYQAAAAARSIAAGATESPVRPLAASIATLETMDAIRAQLGVRFAADQD